MKTKLLSTLLLISTMGVGQHGNLKGLDTISSVDYLKQTTAQGVILLWKDYAKECYNDSTYRDVLIYNYNGKEYISFNTHEIDPGFDPGFRGYDSRWFHKETSFDNFIDWIEKKYKLK